MSEQEEVPKRPAEANVERCVAAVDAFCAQVTEGCADAAEAYRNVAYAFGLVRDRTKAYGEAARKERHERVAAEEAQRKAEERVLRGRKGRMGSEGLRRAREVIRGGGGKPTLSTLPIIRQTVKMNRMR